MDNYDIIDVSGYDYIEHSSLQDRLGRPQHAGYYSPNLQNDTKVYLKAITGITEKGNGQPPIIRLDFEKVKGSTGTLGGVHTSMPLQKKLADNVNNAAVAIKNLLDAQKRTDNDMNLSSITMTQKDLNDAANMVHQYAKKYWSVTHSATSYTIVSDEYLQHHGILGMKWGVRRFQNKDGSLTPEGRSHYGYKEKQPSKKDDTEYGVSPLILPLAVWGTELALLLGIGAVSSAKEGIREAKAEKKLFAEDKQYGLKKEDLKKCNPNFGKDGYNMNCPKCSTVMELRKRGMDVQANSGSGQTMSEMCSWFKNCKYESRLHVDVAKNKILSYPPGSSGFVSGSYKSMGAHVVHWTNIGGEIRVEDGQSGKVYTWDQAVKRYNWGEDTYSVARLDNCAIDEKAMAKSGVYSESDKKGDKKK